MRLIPMLLIIALLQWLVIDIQQPLFMDHTMFLLGNLQIIVIIVVHHYINKWFKIEGLN